MRTTVSEAWSKSNDDQCNNNAAVKLIVCTLPEPPHLSVADIAAGNTYSDGNMRVYIVEQVVGVARFVF